MGGDCELALVGDAKDGAGVAADRCARGLLRTGSPEGAVPGDERVAEGVGRHAPEHAALSIELDECASVGQRDPGSFRCRRDASRGRERRRAEWTAGTRVHADDERSRAVLRADRPHEPAGDGEIARPLAPDPHADIDTGGDPVGARVDLDQALPGERPDRAAADRDCARRSRHRDRDTGSERDERRNDQEGTHLPLGSWLRGRTHRRKSLRQDARARSPTERRGSVAASVVRLVAAPVRVSMTAVVPSLDR